VRNLLIVACISAFSALLLPALPASGQVGRRYPSERKIVPDEKTGVPMTVLTAGASSDAKIYQTHPQWTSDGKWIIFRSSGRAPGSQAYAVNEASGDIIQLTEGAGNNTGSLNIARKSMKLYFVRTTGDSDVTAGATTTTSSAATTRSRRDDGIDRFIELDLARLFADSEAGAVTPAASYERVCATLPRGLRSAQVALDADEMVAYAGVRGGDVGQHLPAGVKILEKPQGARMGAGPGGLRSFDLQTGEMKVVTDTPFQVGHVQTNPWVPGEIIYCWETGGDAPQRMWTVRGDGSGNRPLFVEEKLDWVTHEAVVTKDEVMFNLIGHQARLRVRPTGIAVINLRTDAVQLLGQIEEREPDPNDLGLNAAGPDAYGGFWHCNGSPDGRFAAGDTFSGNIWLIDRRTGCRTMLSTDHKMKPDHAHPTFDAASTKILIQSGHFTDGKRLSLIVLPIPAEILRAK
jgi:oligogalacturonide lyase